MSNILLKNTNVDCVWYHFRLGRHHIWDTSTESGTNMIYMWDFGGQDVKYTTHNKVGYILEDAFILCVLN